MTGLGWRLLIGAAIGVLATWIALIIALAVIKPRGSSLGESLRLLPDLLRLVRRLAADRSLPRGVRIQLALLLIYLASPIDLIPDFVPVLGFADDVIIVIVVLRSVVRRVGLPAIRAHWPGTDDGLAALARLTGLPTPVVSTRRRSTRAPTKRTPGLNRGSLVPSGSNPVE